MIGARQALPGVRSHHATLCVKCVHHLRRGLVGTGDQNEFAAYLDQALRADREQRFVLIVGIGEAPRFQAVGCEYRRLRK